MTYAAKIDKAEARIDWAKPARAVLRHIHGLSPFPGAWCEMPIEGGARVKILRCELAEGSGAPGELLDGRLRVACKQGAIRILELQLTPQSDQGVTYAAKIEKIEARIDWNKPARAVLRHIHGLSPFPGAWCEMPVEGEARVKILRCELVEGSGVPGELLDDRLTVACKDGAIRILELQRAGKQPLKAGDFLRGTPLKPPARLN
ncbi:MAG TPA: hypothetical protein VGO84_07065 [Burkholderiales bacterium]|nr:hypothetical protein [Burkholderiales bacterium]